MSSANTIPGTDTNVTPEIDAPIIPQYHIPRTPTLAAEKKASFVDSASCRESAQQHQHRQITKNYQQYHHFEVRRY